MRIVLVNLSDKQYEESRLRLNDSARRFGITEIRSYDFEEIKSSRFYADNREILDLPRGIGYWLWKPYIILEAMGLLSEGDIVVYSDSGIEITDDLQPLYTICKEQQPVLLFGNGNHTNSMWTKRDSFVLMDCDSERYWKSPHCDAAFSLFRKTERSISFLQAWMQYGSDKRILTDLPNTCGKDNLKDFIEHRWDQSILSLLAEKNRIPLFRMPTQYGNHYKAQPYRVENEFNCISQLNLKQVSFYAPIPYNNSPYLQLLDHHRARRVGTAKQSWLQRFKAKVRRKIKRTTWIIRNCRPYQ